MSDSPSILKSIPAAVDASLALVPADRKGAVVVGLEWKHGVPFATFGTAARVGEHLKLSAEAETRFSKMSNHGQGLRDLGLVTSSASRSAAIGSWSLGAVDLPRSTEAVS